MACANENGLESVAFCCISTGEFRFPNQMAAKIAVRTVEDYLTKHPNCSVKQLAFNVFKDVDKEIYQQFIYWKNSATRAKAWVAEAGDFAHSKFSLGKIKKVCKILLFL